MELFLTNSLSETYRLNLERCSRTIVSKRFNLLSHKRFSTKRMVFFKRIMFPSLHYIIYSLLLSEKKKVVKIIIIIIIIWIKVKHLFRIKLDYAFLLLISAVLCFIFFIRFSFVFSIFSVSVYVLSLCEYA